MVNEKIYNYSNSTFIAHNFLKLSAAVTSAEGDSGGRGLFISEAGAATATVTWGKETCDCSRGVEE